MEFRNSTQKTGENPLNRVTATGIRQHLSAQLAGAAPTHALMFRSTPDVIDAIEAAEVYLTFIVQIVFDCYLRYRTAVDPRWHFTKEAFETQGKTIQDALEELGFPRSWTDAMLAEDEGWRVLRQQQPGCTINDIFERKLRRTVPDPDAAPDGTMPETRSRGWRRARRPQAKGTGAWTLACSTYACCHRWIWRSVSSDGLPVSIATTSRLLPVMA